MNKLLSMPQVAELLGMTGPDLCRRVRRRLRHIAEERGDVQLFQLGARNWFTTEEDIRRLIPELFKHDQEDSIASLVKRQAIELRELRRKVEALENINFARRSAS